MENNIRIWEDGYVSVGRAERVRADHTTATRASIQRLMRAVWNQRVPVHMLIEDSNGLTRISLTW